MDQYESAAQRFRKAMKGIGTDESRLTNEITSHSNEQLQKIKKVYRTMYEKSLEEDIKSEIDGNFLETILGLLEPVEEYESNIIHEGLGTNENLLTQTLCPKEPHEIEILKATYKRMFSANLEVDIAEEECGYLGTIYQSIVCGGRENSCKPVDYDLAKKEAQDLYDAGEGKFGTDESEFIRILCSRSFPQLKATFDAYNEISENDIEKAIKKEMSGDLEKACLAIVKSCRNRPGYYAELIHKSLTGIGIKNSDLIRILVTRRENDLEEIKREYIKLYNKTMSDHIKSEVNGYYEKILIHLIGN
ncbi:annexin A13 [Brachionus plicatilis]|uniref:Annexin n=1 Tax=Brachionus plicatilis TaxID=10195 RepID=A0A3M7R8P1_BRAPC|nr:annexin A13 [Brachionus plicatilis]